MSPENGLKWLPFKPNCEFIGYLDVFICYLNVFIWINKGAFNHIVAQVSHDDDCVKMEDVPYYCPTCDLKVKKVSSTIVQCRGVAACVALNYEFIHILIRLILGGWRGNIMSVENIYSWVYNLNKSPPTPKKSFLYIKEKIVKS